MDLDSSRLTARFPALRAWLRGNPTRTLCLGVLLQAVALGTVAWVVWHETKRETALNEATKYLWRLGWHDALHQPRWVALLIGCLLLYVLGSLLIAMRFAPRHAEAMLAVVLGFLVAVVAIGCVVIVVGLIALLLHAIGLDDAVSGLDFADVDPTGFFARRRKRKADTASEGSTPPA
jgi:hypothetical protein